MVLLAAALPLLATRAFADDEAAKHAAIRKLMAVTQSAQLGQQMMDSMFGQLAQLYPTVPESLWTELKAAFDGDELSALIYDKHFSQQEIETLLAFYESPVGRKMIERMPLVLQEAMQVGNAWGRAKTEEVIRKLKERGFEPAQV
jgi:hypothetical protein